MSIILVIMPRLICSKDRPQNINKAELQQCNEAMRIRSPVCKRDGQTSRQRSKWAWHYPKSLGAYRSVFKRGAVLWEHHSRFCKNLSRFGKRSDCTIYVLSRVLSLKRVGKED